MLYQGRDYWVIVLLALLENIAMEREIQLQMVTVQLDTIVQQVHRVLLKQLLTKDTFLNKQQQAKQSVTQVHIKTLQGKVHVKHVWKETLAQALETLEWRSEQLVHIVLMAQISQLLVLLERIAILQD